jgi:glycosyltransferase involved in cell wall biosynthesis
MNEHTPTQPAAARIGYLLYRYPRYSETFIVNEILSLEKHGLPLSILAIKPSEDGIFHESISRVQAIARYLPSTKQKLLERTEPELDKLSKKRPDAVAAARSSIARYTDLTEDDFLAGVYVSRWARKNNIDHLHVHFGKEAARVAHIASILSGLSWSMTLHAYDIFRDNVDLDLLGEMMGSASATITVSEYNRRYLLDTVPGVNPKRLIVHYNGIDTERFVPTNTPREAHEVLAVGRLIEKKGFTYLVEAAGILKQRGQQLHVTIVGDGKEHESLEQQIKDQGVQDQVTLAGPLPQHVVAQRMVAASCFVLPCVRASDGNIDALPTVLLEAMSTRCPVISTDLCGISEIISHGSDGLLVPPNNSHALADAIEQILTDPEFAQGLGDQARPKVIDRFNADTNGRRLLDLIQVAATTTDLPHEVEEGLQV